MKGEVGGRKPEGEHPRQKAKQEAMADRSARRLWGDTHQQRTSHLRNNVCLDSGARLWSGMGAPCGERVRARSPRPAIYAPAPPTTSSTPNTHTTQTCTHIHSACSSRKSLSYWDTPAPSRTSVDWLEARPDQLPRHTAPPPYPGSRKGEGTGRCLRAPSELSPTGRERGRQKTPTAKDLGGKMDEKA